MPTEVRTQSQHKMGKKILENVAKLKYLKMAITNQNCTYKEIDNRFS
jgi:predicted GNAT family N-acyltransferase